jgi:hypothetical protein
VSVALLVQQAKRMRLNTLSSVAWMAVPHFFKLRHKGHDFRAKKKSFKIKWLFSFLYKKKWARYDRNVHRPSCKLLVIYIRFYFLVRFWKNTIIPNFMESSWWEPRCSMQSDGRTDMTMLMVAFRNFANVPKNNSVLNLRCTVHQCASLCISAVITQ